MLDERLRVKKDDGPTRVARPLDEDSGDTSARPVAQNVFGCDLASRSAQSNGRRNTEAIVNLFRQLAK